MFNAKFDFEFDKDFDRPMTIAVLTGAITV